VTCPRLRFGLVSGTLSGTVQSSVKPPHSTAQQALVMALFMHTPRYPVVRCLMGLFGLFVCVASAAGGESDSRQFECRFASLPIRVDGALDEEAWKHAQSIDRFYLPWLPDRPGARAKTRARLLWDREFLYFAVELDDVDLFADIVEHDGPLWQNDVFELFFKPADDKPGYYEFHVTAAGTVLDAFFAERGKYEGVFKRGVRDDEMHVDAKVRCDGTLNQRQDRDRGWTVEARIPWFDFLRTGGRPDVDETWKFALCRYDYRVYAAKPELSTCAPLAQANFHHHEDYALLRFVGPAPERVGRTLLSVSEERPAGVSVLHPHPLAQLKANWRSVPSRVIGSPESPPTYRVRRVLPALKPSFPVTVINEPGSQRLLFIEQDKPYGPTRLCRTADDPASGEVETLLDLGGLCFSIAFHPRFNENGFVYIGGNGRAAQGDEEKVVRIDRYTIQREPPFRVDRASKQRIIEWDSAGHSGAAMAFGPDGMFYVTSGDGTSDSDGDLAGQRLDMLRSKVLRIDVDHPDPVRNYSVPADNPFVGVHGARPETWAYGLRNPWRMWIDHESGQVWVANNGQDLWEQVYLIERGANYGWSVFEGGHLFNAQRQLGPTPVSKPMFDHSHAEARSMTGGVVYRGSRLPELRGASIYADFATGKIWGAKLDGRQVVWHKELADSPLSITAIATGADGELLIADYEGDGAGGFYTLEPNVERDSSRLPGERNEFHSTFPRTLSETGLFASVPEHRLTAGMIPYSVNSPLWSDGAFKERALYLPPTAEIVAPISNQSRPPRGVPGTEEPARIDVLDDRGWNCPDRTVLVKSFALELEPGNPRSRRWIETRLFTRQEGEWVGYSYSWNDEQTDATLVARDGLDRTFEVKSADGMTHQTWRYPSRAECMVCHSRAANYVLGLSTAQMNKDHDYGGVQANQLAVLESLGVLRVDAATVLKASKSARHDALVAAGLSKAATDELAKTLAEMPDQRPSRSSRLLPRRPDEYPRLADPYDSQQDLSSRVRSYLHANCAHCHVNAGGGNAQINLLSNVPLAKTKLIDEKPLHDTFGIENARLIAPGHPERSVLLHRVATRGRGQMPQTATNVVDRDAVELLREWIRQLE